MLRNGKPRIVRNDISLEEKKIFPTDFPTRCGTTGSAMQF